MRVYKLRPGRERQVRPTTREIAWAAGVFEGEGSAHGNGYAVVTVVQVDPWLVRRLRALFGGSVGRQQCTGMRRGGIYRWNCSGARARGFLLTIYGFLSPRRRRQVRLALGLPARGATAGKEA